MAKKLKPRESVEIDGEHVGSIYLRHKTWWVDILRPFRRKINLKTHDKTTARQLAEIEGQKAPELPVAPTPTERVVKKKEALTLGLCAEMFMKEYRIENRKSSCGRIRPTLDHFMQWAGGPQQHPRIITRDLLIGYRDHRAEEVSKHTKRNLSRASVNSDMQRVKSFVHWLMGKEIVSGKPTWRVKRLKTSRRAPEAASPAVVENVIEAFGESWLADYTVLLANTGLRPQEGLHLRAEDFDEKQGLLHVRPWTHGEYEWQIKDTEAREMAVNEEVVDILRRRRLSASIEWRLLFPSPTGRPWEYHNFGRFWRKSLPADLRKQLSPYDLRHHFATQGVLKGVKMETMRELLGHSSVTTTEQYYASVKALALKAPPVTATVRRVTVG